jgi:hypothetical protein
MTQTWRPTTIRRFIQGFPSSACTALVETDVGLAYLKGMGGPEGPHTLAAEWVGTQLAAWFELSTFDVSIIEVDKTDEIWFLDRNRKRVGKAEPGPAFISRSEAGDSWSGDARQLKKLVNPADVSRLVVFDTWTLNCDRYSNRAAVAPAKPRVNRGNVFLSEEAPKGKLCLKAMDHTHCFTCGAAWTKSLNRIATIKDERLFGMFPEFRKFIGDDRTAVRAAVERLRKIDRQTVHGFVESIPRKWEVTEAARDAVVDLVVDRAAFVADTIESRIWPQRDLDFPAGQEEGSS